MTSLFRLCCSRIGILAAAVTLLGPGYADAQPYVICAVLDLEPYTGIPGHHYAVIYEYIDPDCIEYATDETFADDIEECPDCPGYTTYLVSGDGAPGPSAQQPEAKKQSDERWPKDMRRIGQPGYWGNMRWSEAEKIAEEQDGTEGTKPLIEIEGQKVNIVRVEPESGQAFYAYVFVAKLTDRDDVPIKQIVVCEDTDEGKRCAPAHAWVAVRAALDPNTPANRLPGGRELLATLSATAVPGHRDYPHARPYALKTEETDELAAMLVILGRPNTVTGDN